jgi:hypothetical protein
MVIYKEYKWRDLPKLVHRVTKTVAMVMMVIGFAAGFGYLMAIMQLPAKATAFFLSITNDKYAMLLLINILLLLLGTFMDMAPMILICTPIMLPIVQGAGRGPGALRDDHAAQPRHRPHHPAGRAHALRGLRDRQGDDGGGVARAMAVLRRDVRGAAHRHLRAAAVALAAARPGVLNPATRCRRR